MLTERILALSLKNELLISWAEIFEDFQSLRTTSQSEKFKE